MDMMLYRFYTDKKRKRKKEPSTINVEGFCISAIVIQEHMF